MKRYTSFIYSGIISLCILSSTFIAQGQRRIKPRWYFGPSAGINMNYYRGFTRLLDGTNLAPAPFRTGDGLTPYVSMMAEFIPYKNWGIMLNVAYDNRSGNFQDVIAPCNCIASLSTELSYVAIEPSLKIYPFGRNFYLFGGPTYLFNVSKGFTYKQELQPDVQADFSQIRENVFSAQVGGGIDIPLSDRKNKVQWVLSPFASFQTDLGSTPRVDQTWSIYSIRAGIALKLGARNKRTFTNSPIATPKKIAVIKKEIEFSLRAPKNIQPSRQFKEVLPLRNSVFFDMGSIEIPVRYKQLSAANAVKFSESNLVQISEDPLGEGRSARQMAVYHQILNIIGDRLRTIPASSVYLVGAAENNPAEGKAMAEKVRGYLMSTFHIDSSRLHVEGRALPLIPSEQKGGIRELDLLHEGDRRVDIISATAGMMEPVGNRSNRELPPVAIESKQTDPFDSHVIFTNQHASLLLDSWTIQMTNEQGNSQTFGPFTKDEASIPGNTILGTATDGNYKVLMVGNKKEGGTITRRSNVKLKRSAEKEDGLRFSILFEFDQSNSIATYEQFLTKVVAPNLSNEATVIIHGHTDIIGDEVYNQKLSADRAKGVQEILEKYLKDKPSIHVKFVTLGFGEQDMYAPFENKYPEERFYNRSVIIDILPVK